MNQEVSLKIKSVHKDEDGAHPILTINRGKYYFREGKHYIFYEETDENGLTKCSLTFDTVSFSISRKGAVTTTLRFAPGETVSSEYHTPLSTFHVATITKEYSLETIGQTCIRGVCEYELLLEGEHQSDVSLSFEITPQ